MPRRKINEALVGGFAVVGIVLLGLLFLLMGSLEPLFREYKTINADFPDVQGLQAGDPVFLFGKRAGKVVGVELLPRPAEGPAQIRVAMKIPAEFCKYLRVNSVVKIDKSLTGILSVLILESDGPWLEEGQSLRGTPAAQIGDVTEQLKSVLTEGETLLARVDGVIKGIEEKGDLPAALADLRAVAGDAKAELQPLLKTLRETLSTVDEFIEENRLDIRYAVNNLRDFTENASALLVNLGDTPGRLKKGLESLEKAGSSVAEAIRENRVNIDALLTDLSQAASNAENLSSEIKRRPWRLLYEPSIEEMRALELYDAAWAYNQGATELHRSVRALAARLEDETTGTRHPEVLDRAMAEVKESLSRHKRAEKLFWERLQAEN